MSLMSPALTDEFFTTSATWEALGCKESHGIGTGSQVCLNPKLVLFFFWEWGGTLHGLWDPSSLIP